MPLYSLEERLQGVSNGTLDLTISALSYTPGREAVVHFVRCGALPARLCTPSCDSKHRCSTTPPHSLAHPHPHQPARPAHPAPCRRPFYYSSGVALFGDASRNGLALFGPGAQPGQQLQSPAGWQGLFTGAMPQAGNDLQESSMDYRL